jgi:hypothetical protein
MERKTPVKTTVHLGTKQRWDAPKLLREVRARTRALNRVNTSEIQLMLKQLLAEAGWSEGDFLETLAADIADNGPQPAYVRHKSGTVARVVVPKKVAG